MLYPEPTEGDEAAWSQYAEKNRGDLRHHALDAMVISCTLPWLAHRTHGAKDEFGNFGWWTQDEKRRSKAANPIGLDYTKVMAEIEKVVVRHHVSRSTHRQAYNTTLYAKKGKDMYVARKVFTKLTPKNLTSIYPKDFGAYCEAAWERYRAEAADIEAELKKTKGCIPESFTRKLCFSHFQRWKVQGAPDFTWPRGVKIPIRSVRLVSVKDDSAVMPFSKGTHAYVERTGFKEVRIHLAEHRKSYVPVFIPRWSGDAPLCQQPIAAGVAPVGRIRLGQVVTLKRATGPKNPPGKYRVSSTMQAIIQLIPVHIKKDKDALKAAGYLENGRVSGSCSGDGGKSRRRFPAVAGTIRTTDFSP